MLYILQAAFAGCCSLQSQAGEGGSQEGGAPGGSRTVSPRLASLLQSWHFFSGHHALFLLVMENSSCRKSHTSVRRALLTLNGREQLFTIPVPDKEHAWKSAAAGLAVPCTSPSAGYQVSPVPTLQWLLQWFGDWALHYDPKAFCVQQDLQRELNGAAPPWHSWLPAWTAQPATGAYPQALIAFAVTTHRHLLRAGKRGCFGPQPTAAANLLSSSSHPLRALQPRASRVTSFFLCA